MEHHSKYQMAIVWVMLFLPAALSYSYGFTPSRATYYGGYGNPRGACGYGDYGRTANQGRVAAVSGLWRGGAGCGACYQVRCKNPRLCDNDGTTVVATDYGAGDRTDFIMSPNAFKDLGRNPRASEELKKYGVVDIEYRRVPCRFAGYNVRIKIHESSKYPYYLAIVIQYVPGMSDVTAVEIYQNDRHEWRPMRRAYGAVFDIVGAPRGPLMLRLRFSGRTGWAQSTKSAIPGDWKVGASYDSQVQV
ncbi:expansin-like B1 isoform X2 [Neltuma alba]|uniref:expansin-like B1 isoform X2 n=1 Tax=Neltuma alba TaxID=207710 RepID=UPI0010A35A47|nr:expansin-like B1 isoform X2 [Prosopis alba]